MTARRAAVAPIALAGVVVASALAALTAGHVPDPLPTHWKFAGHADGFSGRTGFLAAFLGASLIIALAATAVAWLGRTSAWLFACSLTFISWLLAVSVIAILLDSLGAKSAATVTQPWYAIALIVLVPLAGAYSVWRLHPPFRRAAAASATPISLAPGERAAWVGSAHSRPLAVLGGVALVVAAVLALLASLAAIVVAVVGLVFVATSSLAVRVDDRGLHTLWGPLGWPRTTVPLDDIAAVRAERIEPLRWGGWGYRISPRGVAAVVRRGPGIVVDRVDKPTYAVTVDHADTGAGLLSALLARRG